MRNPSAAQISKLHQSEHLKSDETNKDAGGLLLHIPNTDTLATARISTPDKQIAANLLAAWYLPHFTL